MITNNVFITGASGFIGSVLYKKLNSLNKKNVMIKGFSRKYGETFDVVSSYEEIEYEPNTVLIHLAQNNNTNNSNSNTEIECFKNLIKKKWKHVIYISSASVYGENSEKLHKVSEIIKGYSSYTNTKITCEKIALEYKSTILRLSNVYGPGMNENTIIKKLINQFKSNEEIEVNELISKRNYLWIGDAVDCIIECIDKKPSKILNVASTEAISVQQLVQIISEISGTKKNVSLLEPKCGKKTILLDIKDTIKNISWIPKVDIRTGIKLMLKN